MTPEQQKAIALANARRRMAAAGGPTRQAANDIRADGIEARGHTILARVGDGVIYETADGSRGYTSPGYSTTDQDAIKRIFQEKGPQGVIRSGFDQEAISQNPVAARVNEFNRGAPFIGSWLDEAVSVASPKAAQSMNALSGAMRREKPGQTMALNALGGVAFSAPVAIAAGPSVMASAPKSLFGRAVAGAGAGSVAGGVEGAVYGSGEQDGGRANNAKSQAAWGAGIGGALGLAAPLVAPVFEAAVKKYRGADINRIASEFGVSKDAARVLKSAFEQNDEDVFERFLKAGPDAMLADAGVSGQALLDAASQTGGNALRITREAVEGRSRNALAATSQALDDTLGPVRGPIGAAREIAESTAPARAAAYDAAFSTPINYADDAGRAVEDALSRVPEGTLVRAIKEANDEMQSLGIQNAQILYDVDTRSFREMPNVRQLDALKKALDGISKSSVDSFGRLTGEGVRASRLASSVRQAAIDATGGADGTYARALKVGGDKLKMDEGLQLGLDMLKSRNVTREVLRESLDGLPEDAREMVKVGLRSHIDDTLARVNVVASDQNLDAREARKALSMLTSRDAREKLGLLLGSDAPALEQAIDRAASSLGLRAAVSQNSKTAVRQAIQGAGQEIVEPGALGTLTRGQPLDAAGRITQEVFATAPRHDAERIASMWADVARAMTETRGASASAEALEVINKAIAGQSISDAEARLIANEIATGLLLSADRSGQHALALQ